MICESKEDSTSCPADCAGKELETTFDFTLGSTGVLFSLKALRDVSVSSFAVNAMSRGEGEVKVYTRSGGYSGHEQSSEGWELVYNNASVTHNRRGKPTELGDFDKAVLVTAGATQSFLIISSKGLVYKAGTEQGAEFVSDEAMIVYEGAGITSEFEGSIYSPRVFGGIVR